MPTGGLGRAVGKLAALDRNWRVPATLFTGTVFILGGSPWLTAERVNMVRGLGQVIAINNAYQLAPWADLLYWADRSWLEWHIERLAHARRDPRFIPLMATRIDPNMRAVLEWPIGVLKHDRDLALSRDHSTIAGWCSGANSLNIAYLGGARRIILMGFEGRKSGHWHNQHKRTAPADTWEQYIRPSLDRMGAELKNAGAEVFNCTEGSALTAFPYRPLGEFL